MNWYLVALAVVVFGAIVLQGLQRIPADPPHKGQATWLGKRVPGKSYNEGWGWFPLFPYLWGFILVKVSRVTFEIVSEKTRTPDRAESRVPIPITFRPHPDLLIEYIDSGQEEGVKRQLTGRVKERIREWAMGSEEGPANWIELNGLQLEAVSVLVREIAGELLTPIPEYAQSVPTWIWLRYLARPQPTKFMANEKSWAENNWGRVEAVVREIELHHGPRGMAELRASVEGRRKDLENLSAGSGKIILRDLGVTLERLNVGDIDVIGKVGEQAEEEALEEQQRQKEGLELRFVRERIRELLEPPFNYTKGEARDIVQTERGKVSRAIDDKRISMDATTAEIFATVFGRRP